MHASRVVKRRIRFGLSCQSLQFAAILLLFLNTISLFTFVQGHASEQKSLERKMSLMYDARHFHFSLFGGDRAVSVFFILKIIQQSKRRLHLNRLKNDLVLFVAWRPMCIEYTRGIITRCSASYNVHIIFEPPALM